MGGGRGALGIGGMFGEVTRKGIANKGEAIMQIPVSVFFVSKFLEI